MEDAGWIRGAKHGHGFKGREFRFKKPSSSSPPIYKPILSSLSSSSLDQSPQPHVDSPIQLKLWMKVKIPIMIMFAGDRGSCGGLLTTSLTLKIITQFLILHFLSSIHPPLFLTLPLLLQHLSFLFLSNHPNSLINPKQSL